METRVVNVNVNLGHPDPDNEKLKDVFDNRNEERVAELHAYIESFPLPVIDYPVETCEEGFLLNLTTAILNKVTGLIFLFKTALFHGWRDFKRSELTVYTDNHTFDCQAVYHAKESEFAGMTLEHPRGMFGSYKDAIASAKELLNVLDINRRTELIKDTAKKISRAAFSSDANFYSVVEVSAKEFSKIEKDVLAAYQKTEKYFTDKRKDTDKFENLYGNKDGIKEVVNMVTDLDTVLRSVAGIADTLEYVESCVGDMVTALKINEKNLGGKDLAFHKKQLDVLAGLVRSWGIIFEKFSIIVNDIYRVNHNVYINMKVMRDKL
jgi:hypothetical protein